MMSSFQALLQNLDKYNDLMSEKHKKVCGTLNYFEHFLVVLSAVTVDCVCILHV